MADGYVFIAAIIFYLFLVQKVESPRLSPSVATSLLMVPYFVLSLVVSAIQYSAHDISVVDNIFSISNIIKILLQAGATYLIFYKIDQTKDSYLTYALWGGLGLALIFFVVPRVVLMLPI